MKNSGILTCPSRSPQWRYDGYSYNIQLTGVADAAVNDPSGLVLFSDSDVYDATSVFGDDYIGWVISFHPFYSNAMRVLNNGANICWYDGHVKWIDPARLAQSSFTP